jgi:hypothetical protein
VFTLALLRSPLLLAVLLGALTPAPETHRFDLTRDQMQSFTFAVDEPGKIVARVTWQGAPLAVSLVGPGGTVAQRTGRGSVELVYAVTPADVGKGSAWQVALHGTERTGNVIAVVAKGTVTIEHPPGDLEKLKAKLEAQRSQQLAQFRARIAQLRPQALAARNAQLARYQQALDRSRQQAQLVLRQKVVALRTRAAAQPVPVGVATGSSNIHPMPVSGSGSGTNAPEPLSITSLSSSEGQPGDAILITGTGFGDGAAGAGTTVHIIVAPGKDIQFGAPDYQSGTQIQTSIPADISGVTDNPHAAIYVKTAGGASALVPFHFKPALEIDAIQLNRGNTVKVDGAFCDYDDMQSDNGTILHQGGLVCGGSGTDVWNLGQLLKNGWTVVGVDAGKQVEPNADAVASVSGFAPIPNVPAQGVITVSWWTTAGLTGGMVWYLPTVYIQGPRGIPWQ